jgi:XapX domain-containing protein
VRMGRDVRRAAMKLIVGLILGALIGTGCRVFAIPLPGPNAILGALLGIAMATGYEVTDRVLSRRGGAEAQDPGTRSVSAERSPESAVARPPPP